MSYIEAKPKILFIVLRIHMSKSCKTGGWLRLQDFTSYFPLMVNKVNFRAALRMLADKQILLDLLMSWQNTESQRHPYIMRYVNRAKAYLFVFSEDQIV